MEEQATIIQCSNHRMIAHSAASSTQPPPIAKMSCTPSPMYDDYHAYLVLTEERKMQENFQRLSICCHHNELCYTSVQGFGS